eukprot:TRINITY_DN5841_c0_g1_i23.p1 TRINITY_DN5841_c0_g1~~TRINITY_DN5841_c0_g1_i23.p1  ORF type:complete len:226 (+),score=22.80 TRINITY_DN5841_c0_g1_i23:188-865(+)
MHYVNLNDMTITKEHSIATEYFGEGSDMITYPNGTKVILQLTWQERVIFVYDEDFTLIRTADLPMDIGEGWGITHKMMDDGIGGKKLVLLITDGSSYVFYVDPVDFKVISKVKVVDGLGKEVLDLNELEFINGKLWANIWQKSQIAIIDSDTGKVERQSKKVYCRYTCFDNFRFLDFSRLVQEALNRNSFLTQDQCLNGIAYNEANKRIIVTGKQWPFLAEITLN